MKSPTYGGIPIDFNRSEDDDKPPRYYWINPTAYICDRCRVFHNSASPCPLGPTSDKAAGEGEK